MILTINRTNAALTGKWVVFGLLFIALALSSSCSKEHSSSLNDNVLHVGNGTEPQDLDPHITTGLLESRIISTLFEGLTALNDETLEVVPAAAERWEWDENTNTYRFFLRPQAKWSDGSPVTAADFVYSWQRILSPRLANTYAYMLFPVKNAQQFHQGKIKDFTQVGVRAVDTYILEVQLDKPTFHFLQLLSHHSTFPVHPPTIAAHGDIDQRNSGWTRPGKLIGNGPFILKSWLINRLVEVTRNPHYWGAAQVALDGVVFHPVENLTTEENMFRTGRLHVTSSLSPDRLKWYRTNQPQVLSVHPSFSTYYYVFNTKKSPYDNPKVRQALSMAIDRESIVKLVTRGGEIAANRFTPENVPGYQTSTSLPFDPIRAKQLLKEAGYPNGKGMPVIQLLYNTHEMHLRIAEAVQRMWQQNIGVQVALHNQEWKVYLNTRNQGNFEVARAGWIGDYLDPGNFLELFISHNGNNDSGWHNEEYDALMSQAEFSADSQSRAELLSEAEALLIKEMPLIPIFTSTSKRLINPRVEGWPNGLLGHVYFQHIKLLPPAEQP